MKAAADNCQPRPREQERLERETSSFALQVGKCSSHVFPPQGSQVIRKKVGLRAAHPPINIVQSLSVFSPVVRGGGGREVFPLFVSSLFLLRCFVPVHLAIHEIHPCKEGREKGFLSAAPLPPVLPWEFPLFPCAEKARHGKEKRGKKCAGAAWGKRGEDSFCGDPVPVPASARKA